MTTLLSSVTWPAHPVADLFPLLEGDEFAALVEDIRENGLHEPVWLYDDPRVLLDGRNRVRACEQAGVDVDFQVYRGADPIAFAVSLNLRRRHLNAGQIAGVGARLVRMYAEQAKERQRAHGGTAPGRPQTLPAERPEVSRREREAREQAAKAVGASGRSVGRYERVARVAPELAEQVMAGQLALDRAEQEIRQAEKTKRVAAIAERTPAPLDSLGPFDVLYVDPPWRYEGATTDPTRHIENQYPTMTLEDIKAMKVPAAKDCVLFVWATSPKLAEAVAVIEAWDFDYRTCMVWVKPSVGMGHYVRQQHELLLIARRGNPGTPDEQSRPASVVQAARGEHSAKPEVIYDIIERMYPTATYGELFARRPRDRWGSWGNQS